jgi:hypothetical protein
MIMQNRDPRYNRIVPDSQKLKIAIARFNGFCANLPSWPKEEDVNDYHALVTALEEASGAELAAFKIPSDKLKPKLQSVRPGAYGGGRGSATYSREKYCDSSFFEGQIHALKHYLPNIEPSGSPRTKYDHLHDWQLQELMMERGIKPPRTMETGATIYKQPDRHWIIAALLRQDNQATLKPSHATTFNVYDSNFNYQSPGANITSNARAFSMEEFANVILGLRELLKDPSVDADAKNEISINIGTIELQLNSAQPNASILRESLKSVKAILENAAGSVIATALSPTVQHILSRIS